MPFGTTKRCYEVGGALMPPIGSINANHSMRKRPDASYRFH